MGRYELHREMPAVNDQAIRYKENPQTNHFLIALHH
jgi:hypothetical protein